MKKHLKVGLAIAGSFALLSAIALNLVYRKLFHNPTEVHGISAIFFTLDEKEKFLTKYRSLPSSVQALEYKFDIYDNGFAPSDWNFEILAKVRAQDIPVWIGKRTKSLQAADLGWIAEMATKNSALGLSGTPTVYQLAGERCSFVAVYVKNSVVALLDTSEGCVAQGT